MDIVARDYGVVDYELMWQRMRDFTDTRDESTRDEVWLVEHPPVFTQGQAGKSEHLLLPGAIPVVKSDRGGQITYHGPGQLVVYPLFDLRRRQLGVRALVTLLEQVTVDTLLNWSLVAQARPDAPGVYVGDKKIASLGLRVRRGCSYHGLSLNVAMDLEPFTRINPCGYAGLAMAQLADFTQAAMAEVKQQFITQLAHHLGDFVPVITPATP